MARPHRLNAPASQADTLEGLIAARCEVSELAQPLLRLIESLTARYGASLEAVVLYGSFRRGDADALIDLYVFASDSGAGAHPWWQPLIGKLLAPNVYYLELADGVRAKYALLSLEDFERHVRGDFHGYFWARFAQPCQWLWTTPESAARLASIQAQAVRRFIDEALGLAPARPEAQALWVAGLRASYACELRAEDGGRAAELVGRDLDFYEAMTAAVGRERGWPEQDGQYGLPAPGRYGGLRWAMRRVWGKLLSVLRLLKAAATFRGGFDYLLWKIHRHSGIYVEPTPRQRRYPLLFAWPLFWRLYRLGAFR
jgi:hypothetical protein